MNFENNFNQEWKQHFPTYKFEENEIALEEFRIAAKALESEERVYVTASNITLAFTAALGSVLVSSKDQIIKIFEDVLPSHIAILLPIALVAAISLLNLKYFSDQQRSITFASRKIIILRRMLGLSYGRIQLLLPTWRVEGANEPLAMKMFPGWFSSSAYPFWMVSIFSSTIFLFLSLFFVKEIPDIVDNNHQIYFVSIGTLIWFIFAMVLYRSFLLDLHETLRLLFFNSLSKLMGLKLANNKEHIIYRAKLACYENSRLGIKTRKIKDFLIFIEDRNFYNHSGISYKALLRSILALFRLMPKSGGSTIVQQLFRSLFVEEMNKTIRRKVIELALAGWVTRIFSKNEILELYIASVRYENQCYGVAAAMNHFWGNLILSPNSAQSFFLIERVSNIRSKLLVNKIIDTVREAERRTLLNTNDKKILLELYQRAVKQQKIRATDDELVALELGLGF